MIDANLNQFEEAMSYEYSTSPIPVASSFVDNMVTKVESGCNHLRLYADVEGKKLYISAWDAGEPLEDTAAFRTAIQDFVDAIPDAVDPAVFDHKFGHLPQADFQAVLHVRPDAGDETESKRLGKERRAAHDDRVRERERERILGRLEKIDPALAQQVRDALGYSSTPSATTLEPTKGPT